VAVIKPEWNVLKNGLGVDNLEITDPRVIQLIANEIQNINANGLMEFEKVQRFVLTMEGFTRENGMLTPVSDKIVRKVVEKYFAEEIDRLYSDNELGIISSKETFQSERTSALQKAQALLSELSLSELDLLMQSIVEQKSKHRESKKQ